MHVGDRLEGQISGLGSISVQISPADTDQPD
jgi:hypothetical protein